MENGSFERAQEAVSKIEIDDKSAAFCANLASVNSKQQGKRFFIENGPSLLSFAGSTIPVLLTSTVRALSLLQDKGRFGPRSGQVIPSGRHSHRSSPFRKSHPADSTGTTGVRIYISDNAAAHSIVRTILLQYDKHLVGCGSASKGISECVDCGKVDHACGDPL